MTQELASVQTVAYGDFESAFENTWGTKISWQSQFAEDTIPFSKARPLQRVLDDAFARSYTGYFEEWLGGMLGRLKGNRIA